MVKNYSAFSRCRVFLSSSGKSPASLSIWNVETNTVQWIPYEKFDTFSSVKQLLQTINQGVTSPHTALYKGYKSWVDKGWYRSIDYYISSRVPHRKTLPRKSVTTSQEIQTNIHERKESSLANGFKKPFGFFQALLQRCTARKFEKRSIHSSLFYQGIKDSNLLIMEDILSGINIFFVIYNVDGVAPGIYSFSLDQLSCIQKGEFSSEMSKNLQGMKAPMTACFTVILVAKFETLLSLMPYPTGLRCTYIESGRIMQRILLAYGQYGLAGLPTPALSDRAVSKLLALDPLQAAPLYSLTVGYPIKAHH